jgi:hypothetical protein
MDPVFPLAFFLAGALRGGLRRAFGALFLFLVFLAIATCLPYSSPSPDTRTNRKHKTRFAVEMGRIGALADGLIGNRFCCIAESQFLCEVSKRLILLAMFSDKKLDGVLVNGLV